MNLQQFTDCVCDQQRCCYRCQNNRQRFDTRDGNGFQVQSETEKNHRILQYFFGSKADSAAEETFFFPKNSNNHSDQNRKNRSADNRNLFTEKKRSRRNNGTKQECRAKSLL